MAAHVSNLSFYRSTQGRSSLYQDAILLIEFFRNEVMAAGGGSIRAWQSLWIEDNCLVRGALPACNQSDRLTISTINMPIQECAITGQVDATHVQVAWSGPGVCCLQPNVANNELSFMSHQVMFTLGDLYSQKSVTQADLANCRLGYQAGQAAGNDSLPPVANWTGGVVSMVNVQTFYADVPNRLLRRWIDANGSSTIDPGEDVVIADNTFDLQIALGYDFNVADGNLTETANGLNDEWLFNSPGNIETFGAGFFVPPAARSQLHSVQVSVILGTDEGVQPGNVSQRRALNGPLRSLDGWTVMEEWARMMPRNSYVFQ
jgi:hypothetical protein